MRKIALFLAAMLLFVFCSAVTAEEAKPGEFSCSVEDNLLVIRVPLNADVPGEWTAMLTEAGKVFALESIVTDDRFTTFTVSQIGNGWDEIDVVRVVDSVCDEMYFIAAEVEDGKFESVYSEHYLTPEKSRMNPYLVGEWKEAETQFHTLTVTDDGASGWNVQIVSPMTHGAFMFTADARFDTLDYSLVYTDGAMFNLPVTEEENSAPGDPVRDQLAGQLYLDITAEDDGKLVLYWENPVNQETVYFLRSDENAPDILAPKYVDVAEGDSLPDGIYWVDIEPADLKAGKPMDVIFNTIDEYSAVDIQQVNPGEMIFRNYRMLWVESTEDNNTVHYSDAATRKEGTMQFVGIPGTNDSVAIDVSGDGLPMLSAQDIFDATLAEDAKLFLVTGTGPDVRPLDREALADEISADDDDESARCMTVVRLRNNVITEVRHYRDISVPDMMADVQSITSE